MLNNTSMEAIRRRLEGRVRQAARDFSAVIVTGPRRSGKTFLLRQMWRSATYHLFEDPDVVARFRADPQGFLDGAVPPVILDEVQNVPEVFAYVRARIDREPGRGPWLLTGSQEAPLMRNVTESMAGRAALLQLWPLSAGETPRVDLLCGGHPEVLARPAGARLWFSSYVQTYLERDVRSIVTVQDLMTFRRFLSLVAARHGQVLSKSDMAAPLGVSVPTIGRWLDVLEATGQVLVVPPYFENMGKRIIKSPKVYFADSGLACHLLGIDTPAELEKSPFLGALFEGLVASEIVKAQAAAGLRRELYFFRDQRGLEVDFLVPRRGHTLLVEAKATRSPRPEMATAMQSLAAAWNARPEPHAPLASILVHRPARHPHRTDALAPGVRAVPWRAFVKELEDLEE